MRGKIPTIEELKERGYKVTVRHYRVSAAGMVESSYAHRNNIPISVFGGETVVRILDSSGAEVSVGVAKCREPFDGRSGDQFNRKIGFAIAYGRATKGFRESSINQQ